MSTEGAPFGHAEPTPGPQALMSPVLAARCAHARFLRDPITAHAELLSSARAELYRLPATLWAKPSDPWARRRVSHCLWADRVVMRPECAPGAGFAGHAADAAIFVPPGLATGPPGSLEINHQGGYPL